MALLWVKDVLGVEHLVHSSIFDQLAPRKPVATGRWGDVWVKLDAPKKDERK